MRSRPSTPVLLFLVLLVAAPAALAAKRTLTPNPANDPALIKQKLDPNRYDGPKGCRSRHPKGMTRLIQFMKRHTRKKTVYGTIRCDGGVHGTGRALDWMLDARKKRQKRAAKTVINTWLARDDRGRRNALARRMGIQLIIYNCRFWQAGNRGMDRYSACSGGKKNADPTQGHIDHMHIELTRPASKLRTSFWETALVGGSNDDGADGGISPDAKARSSTTAERPPLHPPENRRVAAELSG